VSRGCARTRFAVAPHTRAAEPVDDRRGLGLGCWGLPGVDRLEPVADFPNLRRRDMAEDVAVEMHDAALPAGVRQHLRGALDEAATGVRDDRLPAPPSAIHEVARGNAARPDLSSLAPSRMPGISRYPSEFTPMATGSGTLRTSPARLRFMTMPSRNTYGCAPSIGVRHCRSDQWRDTAHFLVTAGAAQPVRLGVQHRVQRLLAGPANRLVEVIPDPSLIDLDHGFVSGFSSIPSSSQLS
jgi:hypothetical protein